MEPLFSEVSGRVNLPEMEERVLAWWRENDTFRRSIREGAEPWVFYEGPPTANGLPGAHHVIARVFKDLFPRYQTMKGRYVLRKGGWDTHGLPVELEVEKQPRLQRQAADRGLRHRRSSTPSAAKAFSATCAQWEEMTDRVGVWMDLDHAYVTMTNEYIESVWWILRKMSDKGLLYQGFKVVPYCPRCGTPLSDHEVAQGYQEVEDPSIFVRFPVVGEERTYFLVWTTTPWTLPGNVALAVNPEVEYVVAEVGEGDATERLILSKALAPSLLGEYHAVRTVRGSELAGTRYEPLYRFLTHGQGCVLRRPRRLCQHRRWHRHRAHGAGVRRRGPGGGPEARPTRPPDR